MIREVSEITRLFDYYFQSDNGVSKYIPQKNNYNFQDIINIVNVVNIFLNTVTTTQYHIHNDFSLLINKILFESLEDKKLDKVNYLEILKLYVQNNNDMSLIASTQGFIGESHEWLNNITLKTSDNSIDFISELLFFAQYDVCAKELLIKYSSQKFYIARKLSFNTEECHELYGMVRKFIVLGVNAKTYDIEFLLYYASLLGVCHKIDVELSQRLLIDIKNQYFFEVDKRDDLALNIIITLTSQFGKKMGEDLLVLLELGLNNKKINDYPQLKAQLASKLYCHQEILNKASIIQCIKEYICYLSSYNDKMQLNFQKQRLTEIFSPPFKKALDMREYEFAFDIAFIWRTFHGVDITMNTKSNTLLVIPNYSESCVIYILKHEGKYSYFEFKKEISIKSFLEVSNSFFGTNVVTIEAIDENNNLSEASLIPNILVSKDYYDALNKLYLPNKIMSEINKLDIKTLYAFESTNLNAPLISIMQKNFDYNIAYLLNIVSQKEIIVNKVLLWIDPDSTLYTASSIEIEAIELILKKNNIYYDKYLKGECSKDAFMKFYSRDDYDLIYISCHGEFDYNNPSNSVLHIEKSQKVKLSELNKTTENLKKERLLLLQACETGTGSVISNCMLFSGFGASLSTNMQSVISHMWAIDSFSSAVFSALFFIHYFDKKSIELAMKETQKAILKGCNGIYEVLESIVEDYQLKESIYRRESIDWDKIFYWGSACYFK